MDFLSQDKTCKRYSHLRGFKVKSRDDDEEEIEERYACKNLIQDQFDKIEDLQQEIDKVEASSKISIKSEKIYFKCSTVQEIFKSTDNNYMLRVSSVTVITFFVFGIIFTSIHGGRGAPLPPPEELLTTSTVPLENLSLAPGDFIILADSTPVPIESAHVSMNVPCQLATTTAAEGNNNITASTTDANQGPSTDIKIMAGVAPDLEPAIPEYIAGLSRPENGKCTYHVQIPQVAGEPITDIAIVNTGNQTVNFTSGNFATISTSTGGPLI